jgi:hypothetical integral membrane protein (TIGR02206 family)
MRQAVYNYLNTFEPFNMFGTEHLMGNIVSLLIVVLLPLYAKRKLNKKAQHTLGKVIGWLVFSNYLIWVGLEAIAGTFDIKLHLPIHLCRFADLMLPLVMVWRSYFVYEILFFWGFSGMLQAAITPDIAAGFPHFHYFRFWVGHQGLILALVYATVVYEMRPTFKSLIKAFIGLNIFLGVAAIVNMAIDANYFWICSKPVNHIGERIPTLLDYLGPWPWYILTTEFVALIHFGLAYSPIYFLNKRKSKR